MNVMQLRQRSGFTPRLITAFFAALWSVGLVGCSPNRQYQKIPASMFTPAFSSPSSPVLATRETRESKKVPSVAVVEYQENGHPWTTCDDSRNILKCQENFATAFIRNARADAAREGKTLVILTFIHGWRNNASWGSPNFVNFQEIVDCMNWGEADYMRTYPLLFPKGASGPAKKNHVSCSGIRATPEVEYAGVYLGWRGQSIRPDAILFWASVVDRQQAATGMVDVGDIQKTLAALGDASKEAVPDDAQLRVVPPARFVVVGHSYGGLILNRVAKNLIEESMAKGPTPCVVTGALGHSVFADLTVVINPADNSIRSAELMKEMRKRQEQDSSFFCSSDDQTAKSLPRPVMLSIHTASDIWTGTLGVPAAKLFGYDKDYPDKLSLPDIGHSDTAPDFEHLRSYGINHAIYLHTLCYMDQSDNGDWVCDRVNKLIYEAKQRAFSAAGLTTASEPNSNKNLNRGAYELVMSVCGGTEHDPERAPDCTPQLEASRQLLHHAMVKELRPFLAMPSATNTADPSSLLNLYLRLDIGCGTPIQGDPKDLRRPCGVYPQAQPAPELLDKPSWNTTPYWTFNVPYHTIQGHSGFWNQEVVDIIRGIASAYDVLPPKP